MSIESYRRNVQRRVTGHRLPTCLPSALEQISPRHSLPPTVYKDYVRFIRWHETTDCTGTEFDEEQEAITNTIVWHLGKLSCDSIALSRVSSPVGLKRVVHRLIDDGFRVSVDVRHNGHGRHTVGLIPTGEPDYFVPVSNSLPVALRQPVHIESIASRLYIPAANYPLDGKNVMGLPPVD